MGCTWSGRSQPETAHAIAAVAEPDALAMPVISSYEEKHLRKLKHFMQQVDAMPWKFSGDLQQERDPEEDAEITVAF
eukprot:symbB.v1.2.036175.t1/scaffold5046.1/size31495/2